MSAVTRERVEELARIYKTGLDAVDMDTTGTTFADTLAALTRLLALEDALKEAHSIMGHCLLPFAMTVKKFQCQCCFAVWDEPQNMRHSPTCQYGNFLARAALGGGK